MLGTSTIPRFSRARPSLGRVTRIVICSDGIFDTQIDAVRVDEERLADMLSGTPDVGARALVDRLVYALRANRRPLHDDVAVMVIRKVP